MYYFILIDNEQVGPFRIKELLEKKIKIKSDTLVWHEGLPDWIEAKYVEELKQLLISTPPPIPIKENPKKTLVEISLEDKDYSKIKKEFAINFKIEFKTFITYIGISIIVYLIIYIIGYFYVYDIDFYSRWFDDIDGHYNYSLEYSLNQEVVNRKSSLLWNSFYLSISFLILLIMIRIIKKIKNWLDYHSNDQN